MSLLRDNLPLLIGAAVLVGLWLFFRTPATELASVASFDAMVGQGDPVVLEFFGNT